ncbi:MAG: cation:proton antiporter [Gammaproteobacteria bacterium]
MDLLSIAVVTSGLLAYALVSGRLTGTIITAPLIFVVFGFAISDAGFGLASVDPGHAGIHLIAEFTLILVLFVDAARIDLGSVKDDHNLPLRMLIGGLPMAMAAGTAVAIFVFPQLGMWEAALLAALLAPTDAALGQSVVSAKAVPIRIRQAINIESGLNDGIALPAVLMFAAMAGSAAEMMHNGEPVNWVQFGLLQVTLGPVVGIVLGYLGARLVDTATRRKWAGTAFSGIGALSLAVFTYAIAELVGGNGFIATFVGGMVFGNTVRHSCDFLFEFMETEGQLLMLITFLIFGAVLLPEALPHVDMMVVAYALLSLTVIRMLPIALSLLGSGVSMPTKLFLGWFGPRGLASILFVLLILEEFEFPHHETLLTVTVITVAFSALLHGLSAAPLAAAYGRLAGKMGKCEENRPVADMPLREGMIETNEEHA